MDNTILEAKSMHDFLTNNILKNKDKFAVTNNQILIALINMLMTLKKYKIVNDLFNTHNIDYSFIEFDNEFIFKIIDLKLDIDIKILDYIDLKIVNSFDDTILHKLCRSYKYNKHIDKILENGPEECNLKQANKHGDTVLMTLCYFQKKDIINKILKYGHKECNLKQFNKDGNTALMLACINHMGDIMLKMLEYGFDNCNLKKINNDGNTILMLASSRLNYLSYHMKQVILKLFEYNNINQLQINKNKETAFMIAFRNKYISNELILKMSKYK